MEIPVEVVNHSLKPAPPALTEPGHQPWKQQTGDPDEQNIKQGDPRKSEVSVSEPHHANAKQQRIDAVQPPELSWCEPAWLQLDEQPGFLWKGS